jgi:hypothetical protein
VTRALVKGYLYRAAQCSSARGRALFAQVGVLRRSLCARVWRESAKGMHLLSKRGAYGWMDGIAGPQRGAVHAGATCGGGAGAVSPAGEGTRSGFACTAGQLAVHSGPCTGRRAGWVPLQSACWRASTCQADERKGVTHMHKRSVVTPHPPAPPIRTSRSAAKNWPVSPGAYPSGSYRPSTCGAHIHRGNSGLSVTPLYRASS